MDHFPVSSRGKKIFLLAQQQSTYNTVQDVNINANKKGDYNVDFGDKDKTKESNVLDISDNEQVKVNDENLNLNHKPDEGTPYPSSSYAVDNLIMDNNTVIEIDDPELRILLESEDLAFIDYILVENDNNDITVENYEPKPIQSHSKEDNVNIDLFEEPNETLRRTVLREGLESQVNGLNEGTPTTEDAILTGRPKKGRKRKYKDQTREIKKRKVNTNKDYITTKGDLKHAKEFCNYICNCRLKCNTNVPTEERKLIFENFYKVGSYEARCMLLQTMIKEVPIKRKRVKGSEKKSKTREYYLATTKVCKNTFMNTLRVSSCTIDIALKKRNQGSVVDGRGSAGGHNKLSDLKIEGVVNHISKFPRYISHYCRSTTKAEYLTSDTTLPLMYRLYCQEHENPVSQLLYKQVFYNKFNLKRKPLKKDTCNVCDRLNILKKNLTTENQKNEAQDKHNQHLGNAEYARELMNKQFETAKDDADTVCISFDLEKTLPLPRIPTNIVFYKRQLWLYNCGIHDSNNKCYCYTWVEGEAGRGAQEIGSCIRKHILQHVPQGTKHVMLWSDSCGGQNRNIKIALMLKTVLEDHPTLECITQQFLVPGHSFLKNDSDFSDIESSLKLQQRLYVANDYIEVMKCCRTKNKIIVEKVKKEDFVGTKDLEDSITNRKKGSKGQQVNWLDFRVIQARKTEPFKLFVKSDFKQEKFVEILIGKREKKSKKSPSVKKKTSTNTSRFFSEKLSMLWPDGKPISKEKLQDLKSMFHLIPKDCLHFYKSLKGADFQDDVDGFSGPIDFDLEEQE